MDDANVPRAGRAVVLPPVFVEKLVIANIAKSTDNSQALANGAVTRFAGFDVFISTAVVNTAGAKYRIIAGHPDNATYAAGLNEVETLRHPTLFADNLRGLEDPRFQNHPTRCDLFDILERCSRSIKKVFTGYPPVEILDQRPVIILDPCALPVPGRAGFLFIAG